jgi:hypothetical protein
VTPVDHCIFVASSVLKENYDVAKMNWSIDIVTVVCQKFSRTPQPLTNRCSDVISIYVSVREKGGAEIEDAIGSQQSFYLGIMTDRPDWKFVCQSFG